MTDKASEGMRRLVVTVPSTLAEATEAAAQQDLASVSYIIRRALAKELKGRGLFGAPERENGLEVSRLLDSATTQAAFTPGR